MVRLAQRKNYIVSQLNAEINLLIDTRLANVLQGHKARVFGAIFSKVGNLTETYKFTSDFTVWAIIK